MLYKTHCTQAKFHIDKAQVMMMESGALYQVREELKSPHTGDSVASAACQGIPLQPMAGNQDVTNDLLVSTERQTVGEGHDPSQNAETGTVLQAEVCADPAAVSAEGPVAGWTVFARTELFVGQSIQGFSFKPKEVSDYSLAQR